MNSELIGKAGLGLVCILSSLVVQAGQWFDGWRQTTPMLKARAGTAAVAVQDTIYVLGGVDGVDFLPSIEYSRVGANGQLGAWHAGPAMQEARGFFAAAVYQGWVYVAGGGNGAHGEHLLASVERARIQPDGGLGSWQTESQTLTQPRRCAKLEVIDGYLYALGGFNGLLLDSVERARIHGDGSLGPWQLEGESMTLPRYIHSVEWVAGALYVVGGHNQLEGTGLAQVESSRPGPEHHLRPWQSLPAMKVGRYGLSTATDRGHLFALGGLNGAIYSDRVEVARSDGQGGLGDWQSATPLSSPRANFSALVLRHRLYVIGGTNRDGYYHRVEYADITADGQIGIQADTAEMRAYQQRHAARQRQARLPLPRSGQVIEVIQTHAYSYLHIHEDGGGRLWLAAPSMAVKVQDRVGFSRGLAMSQFHSRALDRDFERILFVEKVRQLRTRTQPVHP